MSVPVKPLPLLLLACAGCGAFYATAQWSGSGNAAETDLIEPIVSPPPRPSRASSAPSAALPSPAASSAAAASLPVDRSRSIPAPAGDAFAALSWLPPPPPPPPPAPPQAAPKPPAPVAPPLPFGFVGLLENDNGKPQAFLVKGDALFIASVGDVLENESYRIESLGPAQIAIRYLPLNVLQTIDISGSGK